MIDISKIISFYFWRIVMKMYSFFAFAFKFAKSVAITAIARISVTLSTLQSFISVKKFFDEHVYLTQHAHEP
jgi:hypothetical protein